MKANLLQTVAAFNADEDGIETLQVVMIVAIAAIVLIAVMTVGQDIFDWCVNSWLDLSESNIS
jgi:Flp pilus assembly pilin Flp